MTAARPDTWMPIFWGDYVRDTAHLDNGMHGAYLMLIQHYWCTGKPLPDDDKQLWRIARCASEAAWRKLRPMIAGFFQVENGVWQHKRIDAELSAAATRVERRSNAGQKGAQQRWQSHGNAIGTEMAKPDESHRFANGQSQSQSHLSDRTSNLVQAAARASRAPSKRHPPNFRDPKVKQAAWFDRVLTYVKTRLPDDEVASLVASYLEGEPSAKTEWERWASLEKADR